jgi:peroxiredoxin family protein
MDINTETQDKEKLALVINTASYERTSFGISLAAAAAALGRKVYVLFGYGGLVRLRKGFEDEIGVETEGWIRGQIKIGLQKGGVVKISESLGLLRKFGGKVYACPTAMALHNLTRKDLTDELDEVRGVVEFLREDARGATIIYV